MLKYVARQEENHGLEVPFTNYQVVLVEYSEETTEDVEMVETFTHWECAKVFRDQLQRALDHGKESVTSVFKPTTIGQALELIADRARELELRANINRLKEEEGRDFQFFQFEFADHNDHLTKTKEWEEMVQAAYRSMDNKIHDIGRRTGRRTPNEPHKFLEDLEEDSRAVYRDQLIDRDAADREAAALYHRHNPAGDSNKI